MCYNTTHERWLKKKKDEGTKLSFDEYKNIEQTIEMYCAYAKTLRDIAKDLKKKGQSVNELTKLSATLKRKSYYLNKKL